MTAPAVRGFRVALAAALFAVTVDQVTKWLILEIVMQPPRSIVLTPFLNLTLSFNAGISFGLFKELFEEAPLLLAAGKSLIVVALLTGAAFSRGRMEVVGLGLVAGGAAGNIIDRVRQGAVTDFIDFHVGGWHWPAFNSADTAIVIGAALILGAAFVPKSLGGPTGTGTGKVASPIRRPGDCEQSSGHGTVGGRN